MTLEEQHAKIKKQIEEHNESGEDPIEYLKKHNRHTLDITLTNEQVGKPCWSGSSITFFNEDNALSHLFLLNEFFELLTKEENKGWGYKHTSQELVDRIINPIKDRLVGEMNTYQTDEED